MFGLGTKTKEVEATEVATMNEKDILADKVSKIAAIDEQIAEIEGHEVYQETVKNLKQLKKDRKGLVQEVELTVKEHEHLMEGKGEKQVGAYRVRVAKKSVPKFMDGANVGNVLSTIPSVLDVKLSTTGVKRFAKNPDGIERLLEVGIEFEEREEIKVEALKK